MAANQPTKKAADAPTDAETPVNDAAQPSPASAPALGTAAVPPSSTPATATPTSAAPAPATGSAAAAPINTPTASSTPAPGAAAPTATSSSSRPKRTRSTRTAAAVAENQDRELVAVLDRIAALETLLSKYKRDSDNDRKLGKSSRDAAARELQSLREELERHVEVPAGTEARIAGLEERVRTLLAILRRVERLEAESRSQLSRLDELEANVQRVEQDSALRYNEFAAFVDPDTHPDVDSLEYRLSDMRDGISAALDENVRMRARLQDMVADAVGAHLHGAVLARIEALEAQQAALAPRPRQRVRSPSRDPHGPSSSSEDENDDRRPPQERSGRPSIPRGRPASRRDRRSERSFSPPRRDRHRDRSISSTRRHSRRRRSYSSEDDDRDHKRLRADSRAARPDPSPQREPLRVPTPPPVAGPSSRPELAYPAPAAQEGPVLEYYGEEGWRSLRIGAAASNENIPWGRAEQAIKVIQFWTERMDPLGGIPLPIRVERPAATGPNWRVFEWETREQFLQFLSAWNERPAALRLFHAVPVANLPPRDPATDRTELYPPPPPPRDNRRDRDRKGKGRDF